MKRKRIIDNFVIVIGNSRIQNPSQLLFFISASKKLRGTIIKNKAQKMSCYALKLRIKRNMLRFIYEYSIIIKNMLKIHCA